MIKKILNLITVMLFVTTAMVAQTPSVEIGNVEAPPGTVTVPLYYYDFTGSNQISTITQIIEFDGDLLDFTGATDIDSDFSSGMSVVSSGENKITIAFFVGTPGTSYDISGLLMNLNFVYSGGFSSDFITTELEVTNNITLISGIIITDGSISQQDPADGTVSLDEVDADAGSEANLTLTVEGDAFADLASFIFLIEFDAVKLTFVSVSSSEISGVLGAAADGLLTVTWFGDPEDFSTSTDLLNLKFVYNGGGSTPLTFVPGCEVTDSELQIQSVTYTHGAVNPASASTLLTLDDVTAPLEEDVSVPVTLYAYPADPDEIVSIELNIEYDDDILTYLGLTEDDLTGVTASAANGLLNIVWTDSENTTSFADLFTIDFKYNGIGTSDLVFAAGCEFGLNDLTTLPVNYTDGSVEQEGPYDGTVTVESVSAPAGEAVDVPVTFSDFTANAGSVQLKWAVDPALLSYTGFTSSLTGANCAQAGDYVTFVWTGTTAVNLNNADLTLQFVYNGVGPASIVFFTGTQIADGNLNVLNVEYVDGLVAQSRQLDLTVFLQGLYAGSGTMNKAQDHDGNNPFDKFPGTVADQITVELHDASDYSTVVWMQDEVDLNTDGTATIDVPYIFGGSYYLTVKHRNHLETVSAAPVNFSVYNVAYDFTSAANQAYGDNQKDLGDGSFAIFVGDVNQDGIVDILDRGGVIISLLGGGVGYIPEDLDGSGTVTILDRGEVIISLLAGRVSMSP